MTDTTAKIRAKGLDSTGVTEQLADEMYAHKGKHYMAIVEFKVEERHDRADGTRKVDLVLTQVEPAVDDDMAEHLRELSRVGYLNRAHANGTLAINEQLDGERTVADVMAAGAKHRPHPFLPVDASIENGICDVCGALAAVAVHSTQAVLPDGDDEPDEGEEEQDEADDQDEQDAADEATEPPTTLEDPWAYPAPEGVSTVPDPFTPTVA